MFRLKPPFAVVLLAAIAFVPLRADFSVESGSFLFQNYPAKAYAASPQSWAAVQDARGVMYFGNTDCVLEFDGVFWRKIPLSNRSAVRALAIDSQGTVYVGGQGIFGFLSPDRQGNLQFTSLLDGVPQSDRDFGDVWDVLPTPAGVFFNSSRRLFLVAPDRTIKVWRPNRSFGPAFSAYGDLFVTTSDHGLLQMRDGELVRGPGGQSGAVRGKPVFAAGAFPVLANENKLYHFSLSAVESFPTGADSYFAQNGIYSLSEWPGGEIAVGTRNGGLVLLNRDGRVDRIIRKSDGLPSDWITGMYQDRQGAVWLTTASGISRFNPSLTSYGERQGIRGGVISLGRLGGVLYAGTTTGLFRMRSGPGSEPVFEPVTSLQESIWDMMDANGVSLVGAQHGLYRISGTRIERLLATDIVYNIGASRDPSLLYTAGRDGIHVLEREGDHWKLKQRESGTGQEFRTVVEDADGRVWATTRVDIWRIDFRSSPQKIERFAASAGLPSGWKNAYAFHGHTVFATEKGLLRFSETNRRFEPDPELGKQFADGTKAVSIVREGGLKNVWVSGEGYHGVLRPQRSGGYRWYAQPLLESGINEMWTIHADPAICWAAGESGTLFRWELSATSTHPDGLKILLRSVAIGEQQTPLYEGDSAVGSAIRLPFRDNALRFEYAAPFYESAAAVQYQVRLEGSEKSWAPWTSEARKDYTNLPEKTYRFHVRARSPQDEISPEAVFSFAVLPPWYRTWWSYSLYVAVLLFAGWLVLRWRLRILEAKNRRLEQIVDLRTAEVRKERDQNEALLLNILPSPVAAELRATGAVRPTTFEDVTVCFSDFVGFTLSTEMLPASDVISSLNEYFTAFDEIIGRYGLEKLKTIGDAYMFASGLPNSSPSHAVDAVLAALEMVAASRRLARPERGMKWKIRLGLYSGPVVAGVVGVRKFAFDIWGNTVNFASRMESSGAADRVNFSAATCDRICEFIECEPRGPIRIKEGREMEMYFAVGPKSELMSGPVIEGVPQAFLKKYEKAFAKAPKSFPNGETLNELSPFARSL